MKKRYNYEYGALIMIFSSNIFLFGFLPLAALVYYLLKPFPILWRNIWLFLASLFFYAWGEPEFVAVMLLSILMNYGFGLLAEKWDGGKKKAALVIMLVFNVGILFVFKYLNFTLSVAGRFLGDRLPRTGIALPIGISFFTFQAISYVVDVYRGKSRAQKNPLNVGLYIAFFPQLVAGPIVRYETIAEQIQGRKESTALFAEGIERFLRGFCKKVLLSNTLAVVADEAFFQVSYGHVIGASFAWLGALAYTLQIFFDFSGYSDMAIGLGKLFGFQFEENFNYPYIARSITDFWRRWHISLSTWFRDYVYIPLGGSRSLAKSRQLCNLFVVWLLTGIWHGANWTFLLWGIFYFFLLVFEKLTGLPDKLTGKPGKVLYRAGTLLAVMFGWVIFRSDSLSAAAVYFRSLFLLNHNAFADTQTIFYWNETRFYLLAAILLSMPVFTGLKQLAAKQLSARLLQLGRNAAAVVKPVFYICLFLYALSFLIIDFYNPFIYFNF